jgi:hypothetical protein
LCENQRDSFDTFWGNGEKSGAGWLCWLVFRGGPQLGLCKCFCEIHICVSL